MLLDDESLFAPKRAVRSQQARDWILEVVGRRLTTEDLESSPSSPEGPTVAGGVEDLPPPGFRLEYGIVRGRGSALRDLPPLVQKCLLDCYCSSSQSRSSRARVRADDEGGPTARDRGEDTDEEDFVGIPKACLALLLLLDGRGDAAHETILGVTLGNLEDAEHAATHPPSDWGRRHPLSDVDEMVHSIIHRWEGDGVGEGNHTGWDNAMYWAAGEPKETQHQPTGGGGEEGAPPSLVPSSLDHPVRRALAAFAVRRAPHLVRLGVVAPLGGPSSSSLASRHDVLAGGGRRRTVSVPAGGWDPFQFIKLKQRYHPRLGCDEEAPSDEIDAHLREIQEVERHEIALVIKYSMLRQAGLSPEEALDRLCS